MRIGIDVDGVLADQERALLVLLNEIHKQHYTYEDIDDWGAVERLFKISKGDMLRNMEQVWACGEVGRLIDLKELASLIMKHHILGNTVYIVSKRTPRSWPYVIRWLDVEHTKVDGVVFLAGDDSKFDYPIDLMIDDNPKLAVEAATYGKELMLVDQPWNQVINNSEWVTRVGSVGEALNLLLPGVYYE